MATLISELGGRMKHRSWKLGVAVGWEAFSCVVCLFLLLVVLLLLEGGLGCRVVVEFCISAAT